MRYIQLIVGCERFWKLAQQATPAKPAQPVKPTQQVKQPSKHHQTKPPAKLMLDPKRKNIEFYSGLLYNAVKSYAQKLASPLAAKTIFDGIAAYRQSPAYGSDAEIKALEAIGAGLTEAINKLKAAGVDPLAVLKRKGMTNVNPAIFEILQHNLAVLVSGENFGEYKHYALVAPGEANPKDVIELDVPEPDKYSPGY